MASTETIRAALFLLAGARLDYAPSGEELTAARMAWEVALEDIPDADVTNAARGWLKSGETKWPSPAALLARVANDRPNSDSAAWTAIRLGLTKSVSLDGLTPEQVAGYWSLPDSFTRRQMSTRDLDALRGRFFAGCEAARKRAANPTPAKVIPMRSEPPRLVEDIPDAAELARRRGNRQAVAKLLDPPPKAERVIPDERELRERAAAKVAQVRARFGGGR